jgi:microcystin-dependent protein
MIKMAYERVNWLNKGEAGAKAINKTNLNQMDKGIYDLQNVELIAVTDITPTECAKGEKYFNTIDNLIYTATDTNTWGTTGEKALRGILYVVISSQTSYYYNGTTLISIGGGSGGASGDTLPIGSIVPFGGENVPTNWLLCDGSMLNREAYPELFEAIGTSFGTDGPGNFYIPDLRGRVIVGQDTSDADFGLGVIGGEKEHKLTIDEMPKHTHRFKTDINSPDYDITWPEWTEYTTGWTQEPNETESPASQVTYTGGDQPHNNMPPYLTVYMWKRIK